MTIAISSKNIGFVSPSRLFRRYWDRLSTAAKTAIRRREIYRATCFELGELSDRDLADLGIFRADIRRIAREASLKEKSHEA